MARPESKNSDPGQAANDPLPPSADETEQELAELDSEASVDAEPDPDAPLGDALDAALDDGDLAPDDAEDVDLDELAGQCTGREQSIRRALEERREARRLRDDLDYLDFDD